MSRPMARVGDPISCKPGHPGGVLNPIGGASTVWIGGFRAVRAGEMGTCPNSPPPHTMVMEGSPTVVIEGLPACAVGDATEAGGAITSGCPTVLLGGASIRHELTEAQHALEDLRAQRQEWVDRKNEAAERWTDPDEHLSDPWEQFGRERDIGSGGPSGGRRAEYDSWQRRDRHCRDEIAAIDERIPAAEQRVEHLRREFDATH